MRLYLTTGNTATHGIVGRWTGTQTDSAKARKEIRAFGATEVDTKEVEVRTAKTDLLEFLNGVSARVNKGI